MDWQKWVKPSKPKTLNWFNIIVLIIYFFCSQLWATVCGSVSTAWYSTKKTNQWRYWRHTKMKYIYWKFHHKKNQMLKRNNVLLSNNKLYLPYKKPHVQTTHVKWCTHHNDKTTQNKIHHTSVHFTQSGLCLYHPFYLII